MKTDKPLLSVRLMVYNNEPFIAEAIESVLMQQTDFPIEIVIGDDFSTDQTLKICIDYAQKHENIKVLDRPLGGDYHERRKKGSHLVNFLDIVDHCRGKYIAILDGDDYWTDNFKLQKQVDEMEKNTDVVLSFHNAFKLYPDDRKELFNIYKKRFYTAEDLWGNWLIATASVVFRNIKLEIPEWFTNSTHGDLALFNILGEKGFFLCLDEVMCIYRIHGGSMTKSDFNAMEHKKKHLEQLKNMNNYFEYKYKSQIAKRSVGYLLSISYLYARMINKKEAIHFISQSFSTNIVSTLKSQYFYKSLLYLILSWKRKKH